MTRIGFWGLPGVVVSVCAAAAAGEELAWGEPSGGLRLGISCATTTTPADQQPVFDILLENVSDTPAAVPAFSAYLPRPSHPWATGFHAQPLRPILECLEGREATYSISGGDGLKGVAKPLISLKPKEAIRLTRSPLIEQSYRVGYDDYAGKTARTTHFLLAQSRYRIRFGFENEAAEVDGQKVWTGKAVSGAVEVQVTRPPLDAFQITGGFSLPRDSYFLGEPIWVTFRVENEGRSVVGFWTGSDYRGTGRHERFSFVARDEQRLIIPDPVEPSPLGGGAGSVPRLKPGEKYSERLLVNLWCAFPKPGRYTIACSRTLSLNPGGEPPYLPEEVLPALPIESELKITLRDDPEALSAHVRALATKVGQKLDEATYDEIRALALARLEAAFPAVERLALTPSYCQRDAVALLRLYPKEKAAQVLTAALKTGESLVKTAALRTLAEMEAPESLAAVREALSSPDNSLRAQAVLLSARLKSPELFPILMKMGGDSDPLVRRYLCSPLAAYQRPEAIPVLLKLLHDPDPDPFIRIWAAHSLGAFGRKDGVSVLLDLLEAETARPARANIYSVLEDLTGQKLRQDPDEWRRWWQEQGRKADGRKK